MQDWQALPAEVLAISFSHIHGIGRRPVRQVCKRWRDVFDSSLRTLTPRQWNTSLLAKFPYLESLDCSLCPDQVDDTAAHEIPASLLQLQQLKLHGCMINGDFLSAWPDPFNDADIEGRRSLLHLDLSTRRTEKAPLSAALSSFIMTGLQRLPHLADLNLQGRPVAEHGGLWPVTCLAPTLTALTISDSLLWSSEPPRVLRMLEALPEFTALQRLSLQDFWVFTEASFQSDPSLNVLSRLTRLTSLNLCSTHFTTGLEQLAALTALQRLDLSLNPSFNGV
ncbi:hypothetical protein WJX84_008819, partial [Apatococcus fuscideae]